MIHAKFLAATSLALTASAGLFGQVVDAKTKEPEALKAAIVAGQLGPEMAARAAKSPHFSAQLLTVKDTPPGVWVVADDAGHYTLLVDNKHLVVLCADPVGGQAHDFKTDIGDEEITIYFTYETGAEHKAIQGKYVLGAWKFLK
jgi:hypothetical protein